jgi:branched-chain amino acid aminotransferase
VLPSITNKSLRVLAADLGYKVEQREIPYEELETFSEVGTCGTAAVCTAIGQIDDLDTGKSFVYGMEEAGPVATALYNKLRGIQNGEEPDTHGWCEILDI